MIDHYVVDGMVESLTEVREVLIAGPCNAKSGFETSTTTRHVDLSKGVVGAPL
jgi:hypothetical protein